MSIIETIDQLQINDTVFVRQFPDGRFHPHVVTGFLPPGERWFIKLNGGISGGFGRKTMEQFAKSGHLRFSSPTDRLPNAVKYK